MEDEKKLKELDKESKLIKEVKTLKKKKKKKKLKKKKRKKKKKVTESLVIPDWLKNKTKLYKKILNRECFIKT